jgi:hypothetical protein
LLSSHNNYALIAAFAGSPDSVILARIVDHNYVINKLRHAADDVTYVARFIVGRHDRDY